MMNFPSIAAFALLATAAFGQTFTGTMLGTVQDSTGAVLPNVRVIATEQATGVERSTQTNGVGYFEIPLLPPGVYRIDAQLTGFKRLSRANLKLDTSQKMEIPVTMEPGQVTETIEVKAETPLLQTTTSSVSQLIDNKKVVDLPSSNRNLFLCSLL